MYVPLSCSWTFWITRVPFGNTSKRWALEWIDITAPERERDRQKQSDREQKWGDRVRKTETNWERKLHRVGKRQRKGGSRRCRVALREVKSVMQCAKCSITFLQYVFPTWQREKSPLCECQCVILGVNRLCHQCKMCSYSLSYRTY